MDGNRRLKVAVVGATGLVGEAMLQVLAERGFPAREVVALASERSAGELVGFGDDELLVQDLAQFDPAGTDIALFAASGEVAREYAPKFAAAGVVVIDNSSAWRMHPDVPLVVPEVNPEAARTRPRGIIANPNCSTIQLMLVAGPIHREVGIERMNVASYQSVSGAGREALEELARQTADLLNGRPAEASALPVQIAFNVIPHIDAFEPNGYTREELKIVNESRKILGDDSIRVSATAVRVPVFYGHSEAVSVETRASLDAAAASALLARSPGVEVVDAGQPGGYATAVTHASGKDAVYVSRIRADLSHPQGLNLWVVADNVRKGAALNAVQIAELVAAEA